MGRSADPAGALPRRRWRRTSRGWPGPPVWLHRDLAPGDLLPATTRSVFRAAMGVDDATWERGRGWALSKALLQLPYYHRTNPVLAANSRHVIDEVLEDHRRRRRERMPAAVACRP